MVFFSTIYHSKHVNLLGVHSSTVQPASLAVPPPLTTLYLLDLPIHNRDDAQGRANTKVSSSLICIHPERAKTLSPTSVRADATLSERQEYATMLTKKKVQSMKKKSIGETPPPEGSARRCSILSRLHSTIQPPPPLPLWEESALFPRHAFQLLSLFRAHLS